MFLLLFKINSKPKNLKMLKGYRDQIQIWEKQEKRGSLESALQDIHLTHLAFNAGCIHQLFLNLNPCIFY
jgi:hypothetical protein